MLPDKTALEAYLDRVLFDLVDRPPKALNSRVPLLFFDDAHLFGSGEGFQAFVRQVNLHDKPLYRRDAEPHHVDRLDVRVVIPASDSRPGAPDFGFLRVRQVDPSTVRGRVTVIRPCIWEATFAIPSVAHFDIARAWYGGSKDSFTSWRQIGPTSAEDVRRGGRIGEEHLRHLRVAVALQEAEQKYWHVSLGYDQLPSLKFVTDPIGAREVFRLRDAPAGRERRSALLHWVTAHLRQRRDPTHEDMIAVREHLRGATSFVWNGLRCRIAPSAEDADKAKG